MLAAFTVPGRSVCQDREIDSVINLIRHSELTDEHLLNEYYQLAKLYIGTYPDKGKEASHKLLEASLAADSLEWALYALQLLITHSESVNDYENGVAYSDEAVRISKLAGRPWDAAYFLGLKGEAEVKLGRFYDALESYHEGIELTGNDSALLSYRVAYITNIGGIHHYLGDDLKALDHFLQSYYLKKEHNLTSGIIPSLINIASVYGKLEKFGEAIASHSEAYRLAVESGDHYCQVKALTGLGFDYFLMKEYDSTEHHYLHALELSDSITDKTSQANILAKLSNVYSETGKTGPALQYARRALDLSREISYQFGISSFSRTLGDLYLRTGNYAGALPLLQESIEISEEIGAMDNLKDAYHSLSDLYEKAGDPGKALQHYKKYAMIRDSLLLHEEADKFSVVQIKYEMEKKGREVENLLHENRIKEMNLERSRYMLIGTLSFFTLVILFLVLFFRQNRIRSKQRAIVLEQKLLRSQMNPHFIFNTLTAIQKYIYDKSSLLASDYLGRFARLMRFILDSSAAEQISVEAETEFLTNYLELQKLRFNDKIRYGIEIDPEIEPDSMVIPPMLIQPFIENAIEHGIKPLGKGGKLDIRMELQDDYIIAMVEDNGIGREKAGLLKQRQGSGHKSMAMDITRQRLKHFNKKRNRSIKYEINDITDASGQPAGTRVEINIPFALI